MGHDIFGYDKNGHEVSYLRFGAGNPFAKDLYAALKSLDMYAGVSGSGSSKTFTADELKVGMDSLTCLKTSADPIAYQKSLQFLKRSLKTAKKDGIVNISFS